MSLKAWIRRHQHSVLLRSGLGVAQQTYAALALGGERGQVPAIGGGRPVRALPLPPPQPLTGPERRELARAGRSQGTSFFDASAVRAFEAALAREFASPHALALSSGTASLHTAMMAAGIGPGDEVIVPVVTYVATALAVVQAGARVRFADVHSRTWGIDPDAVERAVGPRTKAVVPVHMGGVPCDMRALGAVAERHRLTIIEDAAHAHGSRLEGRHMGTWGQIGCFSFGSPKTITTGEGGALLTADPALARRARMAMNLGECAPGGQPSMALDYFSPETRLDYPMVGWNYRMSAMQAAVGLGQLARFDSIRARRVANAERLHRGLQEEVGLRLQSGPEGSDPCFYTFMIWVTEEAGLSRGELLSGLAKERIDFRLPSNLPLSSYDIFACPGSYPVGEALCAGFLGLRVDPVLGPREMDDTVRAVRRLLAWGRRRQA